MPDEVLLLALPVDSTCRPLSFLGSYWTNDDAGLLVTRPWKRENDQSCHQRLVVLVVVVHQVPVLLPGTWFLV